MNIKKEEDITDKFEAYVNSMPNTVQKKNAFRLNKIY